MFAHTSADRLAPTHRVLMHTIPILHSVRLVDANTITGAGYELSLKRYAKQSVLSWYWYCRILPFRPIPQSMLLTVPSVQAGWMYTREAWSPSCEQLTRYVRRIQSGEISSVDRIERACRAIHHVVAMYVKFPSRSIYRLIHARFFFDFSQPLSCQRHWAIVSGWGHGGWKWAVPEREWAVSDHTVRCFPDKILVLRPTLDYWIRLHHQTGVCFSISLACLFSRRRSPLMHAPWAGLKGPLFDNHCKWNFLYRMGP